MKKIGAILKTWECRNGFCTKWPPWRHQFEFSKNEKNGTRRHPIEMICVNFHQNRTSCLGCSADTHTHRHTHTHTDILGSILTYSVRMTEYKKGIIYIYINSKTSFRDPSRIRPTSRMRPSFKNHLSHINQPP